MSITTFSDKNKNCCFLNLQRSGIVFGAPNKSFPWGALWSWALGVGISGARCRSEQVSLTHILTTPTYSQFLLHTIILTAEIPVGFFSTTSISGHPFFPIRTSTITAPVPAQNATTNICFQVFPPVFFLSRGFHSPSSLLSHSLLILTSRMSDRMPVAHFLNVFFSV